MQRKVNIKEKFKERYSKLTDYDKFMKFSLEFPKRSIRVNTLKISVEDLKKRLTEWKLEPISWCKEGFFISGERRDVGNLKEHIFGYFFIQEASSMVPAGVLDPKPSDIVLDMCASPGAKTTQIAAKMENKGVLVANDYKLDRIKALGLNLQRNGVLNAIISFQEGRFFKDFKFDKILVDAPCSGTGTISKSLKTLELWSPNLIKRICGTQRQLIRTGFGNLKKDGVMVYSTCSLEPEEDEGIVSYLLETFPNAKLDKIDFVGKRSEPILEFEGKEYNKEVKRCLRIWPQDNNTDGFFVAKIRKV